MKSVPEGGTLGDVFKSWLRDTGKHHPADRDYVTPPESALYLYGWFWECAQGRPLGPEGISMPIPSVEIKAWAELSSLTLRPWELTAIRALDACFLKVSAEKGV